MIVAVYYDELKSPETVRVHINSSSLMLLLSGTGFQSCKTSLVHRDNCEAQYFKELRCLELHCLLEIANLYIYIFSAVTDNALCWLDWPQSAQILLRMYSILDVIVTVVLDMLYV